jgi:hypothetical protein
MMGGRHYGVHTREDLYNTKKGDVKYKVGGRPLNTLGFFFFFFFGGLVVNV